MRRLLLLLGALLLAGATALAAPAAQKSGHNRYTCSTKVVDIYFWPHGHAAIPRLKFPAFKVAHVEVYKAHSVAFSGFLAAVDAEGGNNVKCRKTGSSAANVSGATTTKQMKLRCKLGKTAQIVSGPKNVLTIVGGSGSSAAAQITIKSKGSKLSYSKHDCKSVGLYS